MSRSRHSCSECLGGSKTWSASSSLSWPVKSSIGEMSRRTSATPSSRNHWNDSRWTAMRSGSWRTSRSLAKDRRSRDARRANVTPLREGARRPAPDWSASARTGRHGYANISARRRFPATNVPEVRRHGGAVLGGIRRPPRGVKTRSWQKPRNDATYGAGGDREGRGGRSVELLLARLAELVELEDAHGLEDVQQLLGAELGCHGDYSSCSEDWEASDASVEAAGSEAAR